MMAQLQQQDDRIQYYATLCEQLYNPNSIQKQTQIQQELEQEFPTFTDNRVDSPIQVSSSSSLVIQTPTETASALRILLEASPNPYVQTFCLSRLKQLITSQFSIFDTVTKLQLRTFLLEYAFLHSNMLPFIIVQLAGVFTQLTRMGWVELEEYQQVESDLDQFLQASMDHRILGLHILSVVVQDINTTASPRYAAMFRKAASGFRDSQLLSIFKMAFRTLEELVHHTIRFDNADQEARMREYTLRLLVNCLSYDFAGTSVDEAGEDVGTVQIPTSWRSVFEQDHFVTTFFLAYQNFTSPHTSKAMECLVLLASTRKALFTGDAERSKFVVTLMQGIQNIIIQSQGMDDSDNYNEFCRLLFRFRAIAPISDLSKEQGYEEWISMVADFTIKAFQSWKWSPNTASYLLGFWSRTVETMNYYQQLDGAIIKKLESITVELVRTYILTNVQSVPTRVEEMLDDPLEDESNLVETLFMLGKIARCQYQESSSTLVSVFDPIAMEYQEWMNQAGLISTEEFKETLDLIETKFAWLVYFAAVFIGNRPAFLSSDDSDDIDGKITTKVLQLMQANQTLQNQHGTTFLNSKLDSAFIYFFQQFRKSYIGESAKAVYNSLTEVFGISDQIDMLEIMMRKIVTNLQYWGKNEPLIRHTLELFNDLASGYSALKNLRKTETTRYLLQNHMNNNTGLFGLFDDDNNNNSDVISGMHRHNRMLYYQILCKVLFAEDVTDLEFDTFMKGFEQRLDDLAQLNTIQAFQQIPVKMALHNIFRDLRGIMMAMQSKRQFSLFLEWFYPDYMPIVSRGLEAWAHDALITTTLLKFMAEFVHNKNQRLNFDVSSPNGILMFRDASQLVCIYGRHILEKTVTQEDRKYQEKYKGISICFQILSRCLSGKYINFGVFWLYQDKTIDQVFRMMFQLMLDIPMDDLMNFPKVTKAYFQLLDEFSTEQLKTLPILAMEPFVSMLEACEQGIQVPDAYIRTHACATLDHVFTMILEEKEQCQGPSTTKQQRRHQQQQQRRSSQHHADWISSSSSSSSTSSSATCTEPIPIPTSTTNNNTTTSSTKSPLLSSSSVSPTLSILSHPTTPHWCLEYLQVSPLIAASLFVTLFGLILFDDNSDQWQLSRPLYVLTLIQKEVNKKKKRYAEKRKNRNQLTTLFYSVYSERHEIYQSRHTASITRKKRICCQGNESIDGRHWMDIDEKRSRTIFS
ncbi:armadillo-type protein [Halteromyces radiatus]|uniref:armadillo-type protein n=1 Tax=Halteromyces radiatus TaxID=101107 RepID=UPI00221FFFB7|nr:armadillo-type protein [Halteromyces radiatus]KAI8099750.1 armadillo-type protein [Halteromyces radiatus]